MRQMRGTRKQWFAQRTLRQRLRRHLTVSYEDGRLIIERRWQPHAFALGLYGLFVVALLWLPWADATLQHFLNHHPGYLLFVRLVYAALLITPVVYARRFWRRPKTFVFDRPHDYITADDRVVCALSDVQSIRVGKPLNAEGELKGLELIIHGRTEVPVEWDDLIGTGIGELGQVGLALSQYAQVPLWADGEWRNPADMQTLPPDAPADPTRTVRGH